eukprot:752520-Hanusia_phi.AAC.2
MYEHSVDDLQSRLSLLEERLKVELPSFTSLHHSGLQALDKFDSPPKHSPPTSSMDAGPAQRQSSGSMFRPKDYTNRLARLRKTRD